MRLALGLKASTPRFNRDGSPVARRGSNIARDPTGRRASCVNVTASVATLFNAVCCGDLDDVIKSLKEGVPVDSLDDDGNTALIIAAEGEPGIVEELLERGAKIDSQNHNGVTALIAAVKYEDPSLVSILIAAGADLTLRDRKGRAAADFAKQVDSAVLSEMLQLFNIKDPNGSQKKGKNRRRRKSMVYVDAQTRELLEAVTAGLLPKVTQLLYAGSMVDAQDDDGNTALIFAAEGEPMILEHLLKSGADIDHQNRSGNTALCVAIRAEDPDCIRLLLDASASTTIKNKEGLTPVDLAQKSGNEQVLRQVLGLSEGLVVKAKSAPALKMEVMRRGSLPSCSSADRRTRAFFESISEGDFERVERILQMEFDVNVADDAGCRPLHFAVEGEKNMVALLLREGADVEARNNAGETPLMMAIRFGDVDCIRMVLKANPDVSVKDGAGRDAMSYAEASSSSLVTSVIREAARGSIGI